MELSFKERGQEREFAAKHGSAKLEEELDSGRLDLRSTLLVEQWLDDEPMRVRNRRVRRLQRLWNVFVFMVWAVGAGAVVFLLWLVFR